MWIKCILVNIQRAVLSSLLLHFPSLSEPPVSGPENRQSKSKASVVTVRGLAH